MNNFEKRLQTFSWAVTLMIPLIVVMFVVRLLISSVFARVEYRLPGFPDDPFGFTLEERERWSKPSIQYLVNFENISYLEALTFDDGEPLFNNRELKHMEDVKVVVTGMRIALWAATAVLFAISWRLLSHGRKLTLIKAFWRGGWGVVGSILTILIFIWVNFNKLFTWFHQVFFESGTWQFHPSNTLIRLFPLRFWQDAFIFVGFISLFIGGLIIILTQNKMSAYTNEK